MTDFILVRDEIERCEWVDLVDGAVVCEGTEIQEVRLIVTATAAGVAKLTVELDVEIPNPPNPPIQGTTIYIKSEIAANELYLFQEHELDLDSKHADDQCEYPPTITLSAIPYPAGRHRNMRLLGSHLARLSAGISTSPRAARSRSGVCLYELQ